MLKGYPPWGAPQAKSLLFSELSIILFGKFFISKGLYAGYRALDFFREDFFAAFFADFLDALTLGLTVAMSWVPMGEP